jgi:CheY-like chemotaxis protein
LELLRRERPSALLLDLMMPPPDGFEVLYRLRQDPELRDLPVIIVTAKELTASDQTILAQSAQRVIRKGPDSAQLIEEVLRAIAEDAGARETRSA